MSDDHDDYLWTGQGPVALEIASLERELRSLRWQPRELSLSGADASLGPTQEVPRSGAAVNQARWWPPLIAGLIAAAAVLALLLGLRGSSDSPGEPSPTDPTVQPSGSPPAGELVDPFGGDTPTPPTPSSAPPQLVDPFSHDPAPPRPSSSPDLTDPFADSQPAPPPAPPRKRAPTPNLKDPFADSEPSAPREPGKLYDPFTGEQKTTPRDSPDLKDPFRR
ncbi:MAG: hypothetical protein R6X02_22810 [Enhygromyxa sp.]